MKRSASKLRLTRVLRSCSLFGLLFLSLVLTSSAQTTTFAQFFERAGTQDFVFTNNTTSADFTTVAGGSPIFLLFQNLPTLDPSLQGIQNAHLTITTTTTDLASFGGGNFTQPLNQQVTVSITRDTPAPVGRNSRTNLLTAVFTPAANTPGIVGAANSANLSATTPDHNIVFTSDFLLFHQTTSRNLALSFSSVTPALALGAGSFLQNFTAAGSGTFASNPLPTLPGPTAAGVSVTGRVMTAGGLALRNADVVLIEPNGTAHTAKTSGFGYFSFSDIPSGQTVLVAVRSKRYGFQPHVISLGENATGIDFVANQ